jgi:hypothetical protein
MLDIQATRLLRVFLGRDEPMVDAAEGVFPGKDEWSAAFVDVLKTTLIFAAIGSLLTAIVLMLV